MKEEKGLDTVTFMIRIVVCFILSTAIGIERQYRHRMVGLRTNVLVSLGAFMFMCISFGIKTTDETRIAAQVVSGIGFLGAGVILRDGNKIKGLNTAATLWCVAAIGVLTASGMVFEATVGTLLVLFSNILLRVFAQRIMDKAKHNQTEKCTIKISCEKKIEVVIRTSLTRLVDRNNLTLQRFERNDITKEEVKLNAIIYTSRLDAIQDIVNKISVDAGVTSIAWEHEKLIKMDNEDDEEDDSEDIISQAPLNNKI